MTFKEVLKNAPKFRELRIGEFGYMLADLDEKVIHISNLFVDEYPVKTNRYTTKDFGEFVVAANELFKGSDLLKVVEAGLKIHQGFFNGTY